VIISVNKIKSILVSSYINSAFVFLFIISTTFSSNLDSSSSPIFIDYVSL